MIAYQAGFWIFTQADPEESVPMGKTKKLPDFIQKQIDKREAKNEKSGGKPVACKKKKGSKPKK